MSWREWRRTPPYEITCLPGPMQGHYHGNPVQDLLDLQHREHRAAIWAWLRRRGPFPGRFNTWLQCNASRYTPGQDRWIH